VAGRGASLACADQSLCRLALTVSVPSSDACEHANLGFVCLAWRLRVREIKLAVIGEGEMAKEGAPAPWPPSFSSLGWSCGCFRCIAVLLTSSRVRSPSSWLFVIR
jgi:hypothetical protein